MTAGLDEPGIDQHTGQAGQPDARSQTAPDHPANPHANPAAQADDAPRADDTPATAARYTQRSDGWTPDRQRGFLEHIAEGATVDEASASVGLSPGAAYSLRRRAAGAAFALGWDAAKLVARPIVAETLFLRAIAGQTERVTRPDGEVIERHRYDNRLAMSLLNRLDRHADAAETANAATRMVAAEFDAFLDIIERDAGPARAGLFLGQRLDENAAAAGAGPAAGPRSGPSPRPAIVEAAMAPILALARADRWLRSAAGVVAGIDVSDLDPAVRADWTAAQWARAEAAGLLQLAPPPAPAPVRAPQPTPVSALDAELQRYADRSPASALPILRSVWEEDREGDCPVWYDTGSDGWHTCFPPAQPYFGSETGPFGEEGYSRECSDQEAIILDAPHDREVAERVVTEGEDRDLWFVGYAIDGALVDAAGAEAAGVTDADRVAALAYAFDPLRADDPDDDDESDDEDPDNPEEPGGDDPDLAPSPRSDCPSPVFAAPAPKSDTGRSPAVSISVDGKPDEHLQQDQVRNLW